MGSSTIGNLTPIPALLAAAMLWVEQGGQDFRTTAGAIAALNQPGIANVVLFGANGDGQTDCTAAVVAATASLIGTGGSVYFPATAHPYVIGDIAVNAATAWNNITFRGEAPSTNAAGGSQLLLKTTSSNGFLVTSLSGIRFRYLTFLSPSGASPPTQVSGRYIEFNNANTCAVVDVAMYGAWDGIRILGNSTGIFGDRFFCRNFGNDGVLVNAPTGGAIYFTHVQMDQDNSTFTPNAGVEMQAGSNFNLSESDILHCKQNFLINPSGSNFVEWCYLKNVKLDAATFSVNAAARGLLIAPTGTASVSGIIADILWTSTAYNGVEIRGTASTSIRNIQLGHWQCLNNSREGLLAVYCYGLSIVQPQVESNSTQANGTYAGIRLGAGMNSIAIQGGNLGGSQAGFTGLHSYNLQTDAAFAGVLNLNGVDVSVGFGTGVFNFIGLPGAGSEASQCPGWNPLGIGNIPLTGSPQTYTSGITRETISWNGGTVSNITVGGQTLFATTNVSVTLNPVQSVTWSYTGVPVVTANRA